ncbi:MAG: hypothetical protein ACE15B_19060 [Bryobacteraceae bacterium]
MRANRTLLICLFAILALTLSCSTGPRPPQPGTPGFYWAAARQTYAAGDYQKTAENLALITKSDNEFTQQARVWEVILTAGLAQGYYELAEHYEAGARANRKNPMPFRRQVTLFRGSAANAALQFTEAFHRYQAADKSENVVLKFDYPSGSITPPQELEKTASGIFIPEAELERLQRATLQHGVVLSACRATGAPESAAKAQEIFKAGQAPRNTFVLAMANMLHDQSQLFTATRLDQPNRMKLLLKEAQEAVAALPPSKPAKDLAAKIEKTMKKAKIS